MINWIRILFGTILGILFGCLGYKVNERMAYVMCFVGAFAGNLLWEVINRVM